MTRSRVLLVAWLALLAIAGCSADPTPRAAAAPAPTVRPAIIGVTGYVKAPGERGDDGRGQFELTRVYWEALQGAGAHAIHLVPVPDADVGLLLDRVDGLLLAGGPDLDPAAYGEEPHPSVVPVPRERQAFDLALVREALRRDMPILGVCLGSQELNVALGGTLIQDVPTEIGDDVPHGFVDLATARGPVHAIELVAGTPLAEIYGTDSLEVNSAHHQASDQLGEGLEVAARAPDGVIEAFYSRDEPFAVGVQYHPELQREPAGLHAPLFAAFVAAARDHAGLAD